MRKGQGTVKRVNGFGVGSSSVLVHMGMSAEQRITTVVPLLGFAENTIENKRIMGLPRVDKNMKSDDWDSDQRQILIAHSSRRPVELLHFRT